MRFSSLETSSRVAREFLGMRAPVDACVRRGMRGDPSSARAGVDAVVKRGRDVGAWDARASGMGEKNVARDAYPVVVKIMQLYEKHLGKKKKITKTTCRRR